MIFPWSFVSDAKYYFMNITIYGDEEPHVTGIAKLVPL